jgi:hypothetical protein
MPRDVKSSCGRPGGRVAETLGVDADGAFQSRWCICSMHTRINPVVFFIICRDPHACRVLVGLNSTSSLVGRYQVVSVFMCFYIKNYIKKFIKN